MEAIYLGGIHAERAVHEDGDPGQLPVAGELMQRIDDLLGAADRKRGDDDLAPLVDGLAHEPSDLFVGVLFG